MVTLRHLKIFVAVADTKKMSEAAEKLYISQPTVSQTILELEKFYQIKLFERYPKELRITKAGCVFLEYANHIIKSFDDLNEVMIETHSYPSLRVGGTLTVGNCILCQILDEVKEVNPAMDLMIHINNTKIIETKLLQNELDVAIVEGNICREEIIKYPIIKDCLVLICSKNHAFAKRDFVPKEELAKESFILREKGSGTRELFENFMHINQIPLTVQWECNSFSAIKQAVIHNYGLAVLSARLIREELEKGELHIVPVKDCKWKRFFYLCYHKNKAITKQMQCFHDIAASYSSYGISCPLEEEE